MAADKNQMLSSANYYAGLVSSAKNACSEAEALLNSAQATVQGGWKGESGDAMVQALLSVKSEISTIYSSLASLESQMRTHAQGIYNNWPEEDISET